MGHLMMSTMSKIRTSLDSLTPDKARACVGVCAKGTAGIRLCVCADVHNSTSTHTSPPHTHLQTPPTTPLHAPPHTPSPHTSKPLQPPSNPTSARTYTSPHPFPHFCLPPTPLPTHLLSTSLHFSVPILATPQDHGVSGRSIYIYGEAWDFGEVAGNQRGRNAAQMNLAGEGGGCVGVWVYARGCVAKVWGV